MAFNNGPIRVDFYLAPRLTNELKPENRLGSRTLSFWPTNAHIYSNTEVLVPFDGTLPTTVVDGVYRLAVSIDAGEAIAEFDEGNNEVAAGADITVRRPRPDLEPITEGLTMSSPIVAGQPFTITVKVRNHGPGALKGPANFDVRFRAVPVGAADPLGGIVLATTPVMIPTGSQLPAQGNLEVTRTMTAPAAAGQFHLGIDVDYAPSGSSGAVLEEHEDNNNLLAGPFSVSPPPRPDLIMYELVLEKSINPMSAGYPMVKKLKIFNQGTAAVPVGARMSIAVRASTDDVFDDSDYPLDLTADEIPTGFLEPQTGVDITNDVFLNGDIPPGSYFVVGKVNHDGSIDESNLGNNTTVSSEKLDIVDPCAPLPKATYADAARVFNEILTDETHPDGTPGAPTQTCTNYAEDRDFFDATLDSPTHENICNAAFRKAHEAKQFVERALLAALHRACAKDELSLFVAEHATWLAAKAAADEFVVERGKAKSDCDTAAAINDIPVDSRRYCQCSNGAYLSGEPPPYPGQPDCPTRTFVPAPQ